jgi:tRNA pseudouridine13 synthase
MSTPRFLTALRGLPPLTAVFRETADDFEVDEVPLYEPAGVGDHTYVRIEKRGVSTAEALRGIARRLGRKPGEIGVAGLKDAKAVARQTISIEHLEEEHHFLIAEQGRVRALWFKRHKNKLRTGHLRGNHFRVVLREAGDLATAQAALDLLAREGIPNRFGLQRFGGTAGRTHLLGRELFRGDAKAFVDGLLGDRTEFPESFRVERQAQRMRAEGVPDEGILRSIHPEQKFLYVSAAQAAIFNDLLDQRMAAGTVGRLEAGDVAFLHRNGAAFVVEDAAAEQGRADAFEVSPAGPLFGEKLLAARGEVAERERAALERFGLSLDDMRRRDAPSGARRPYRVRLEEPSLQAVEGGIELRFFLPAGSYATAIVSEMLQRDVA